jgi:flagellar motor switch protein FliN/FliY
MSEENTENKQEQANQEQENVVDSKDDSSNDDNFVKTGKEEGFDLDKFKKSLQGFSDVKLNLTANLGQINMPISQFLRITRGSIIELGKSRDDDIDIFVNNKMIAHGEILVETENISIEVKDSVNIK